MTITAMNAQNLQSPWTHWFMYGDSGAGKTKAASTFPRPVFLVPENEGSITTLRGMDMPYYTITDKSSPLRNGRGGMVHVLDELEHEYASNPDNFPFDTIVVESLTHFADLAVEEISNGATVPMDQFRWGLLSSHLRNLQARLRRLDVHAVFTALAKTEADDNKVLLGLPMVQGQAALKIPSACDVIAYCEVSPSKNAPVFSVHTRRYKHFIARSRFKRLPARIDNFNFADIADTLGADAPATATAAK